MFATLHRVQQSLQDQGAQVVHRYNKEVGPSSMLGLQQPSAQVQCVNILPVRASTVPILSPVHPPFHFLKLSSACSAAAATAFGL